MYVKNIGALDRSLRFLLAAVLIGLEVFYFKSDAMKIAAFALAVSMVVVNLAGFCPLYRVFSFNSRKN